MLIRALNINLLYEKNLYLKIIKTLESYYNLKFGYIDYDDMVLPSIMKSSIFDFVNKLHIIFDRIMFESDQSASI